MTTGQFKALMQMLTEIRDALADPVAEIDLDICGHERKVSVSTLSDPDHWICPDCGEHLRQ